MHHSWQTWYESHDLSMSSSRFRGWPWSCRVSGHSLHFCKYLSSWPININILAALRCYVSWHWPWLQPPDLFVLLVTNAASRTLPTKILEASTNGGTQTGWFMRENPIKMDDLEVPQTTSSLDDGTFTRQLIKAHRNSPMIYPAVLQSPFKV